MIKNKLFYAFLVFGLLTVTSSVIGLLRGDETTGNFHILLRFFITFLVFGSLYLFDWFYPKFKFYQVHILHYVLTMAAVFLLVAFSGHFVELHPNAYRDIFLNFTAVYVLISIGEGIVYAVWHRRINKLT